MTGKPQRIQIRRVAGWHMPENTVYVGRPSRWGNPWRIGFEACGCRSVGECEHNKMRVATAQEAVEAYRMWMIGHSAERRERKLAPLRGKNLACWCKPNAPCHGDVLLELANP